MLRRYITVNNVHSPRSSLADEWPTGLRRSYPCRCAGRWRRIRRCPVRNPFRVAAESRGCCGYYAVLSRRGAKPVSAVMKRNTSDDARPLPLLPPIVLPLPLPLLLLLLLPLFFLLLVRRRRGLRRLDANSIIRRDGFYGQTAAAITDADAFRDGIMSDRIGSFRSYNIKIILYTRRLQVDPRVWPTSSQSQSPSSSSRALGRIAGSALRSAVTAGWRARAARTAHARARDVTKRRRPGDARRKAQLYITTQRVYRAILMQRYTTGWRVRPLRQYRRTTWTSRRTRSFRLNQLFDFPTSVPVFSYSTSRFVPTQKLCLLPINMNTRIEYVSKQNERVSSSVPFSQWLRNGKRVFSHCPLKFYRTTKLSKNSQIACLPLENGYTR